MMGLYHKGRDSIDAAHEMLFTCKWAIFRRHGAPGATLSTMLLIAGTYSSVDEDQVEEFGWIGGDVWGTGYQWRFTVHTDE